MAVESDMATYLKAQAAVSAIIGTRIYATRAPQNTSQTAKTQARIVYKLLPGSRRFYHSTGTSGLVEATIQFWMTATTMSAARTLYDAVQGKIDAFRGTWGTTTIKSCFLSPPFDASGDPTQGDDTGFWSVGAVAEVIYAE